MEGVDVVLAIHNLDSKISAGGEVFGRMEAADDLRLQNSMLNIRYEDEETKKKYRSHV